MSIHLKRIVFWTLVCLFLIDTIIIYTGGSQSEISFKFLTENAKKGKLIFQEYNCNACHQIYGLGGYMGPDLTNVISTKNKGEVYASSFIKYGTERMPNLHLSENEITSLVAYLKYVDKTGVYPLTSFENNFDGTIKAKRVR